MGLQGWDEEWGEGVGLKGFRLGLEHCRLVSERGDVPECVTLLTSAAAGNVTCKTSHPPPACRWTGVGRQNWEVWFGCLVTVQQQVVASVTAGRSLSLSLLWPSHPPPAGFSSQFVLCFIRLLFIGCLLNHDSISSSLRI